MGYVRRYLAPAGQQQGAELTKPEAGGGYRDDIECVSSG